MTTRRDLLRAGLHLAALPLGAFAAPALAARARITTTQLAPGAWLLDGAGCNVLAMRGPEGALLVDGGYAEHSKVLLQAAARATGAKRVATLINTHWHPAQTGSNEAVGRAGGLIVAHEMTQRYLARPIASVDYEGLYGPLPEKARPTKTTRGSESLVFAGQQVDLGYLPAAHTNGDLYVHLPAHNLLVAGGPVQSDGWPLLDWRNGAWLGGLVKGHEQLARLVKPDTQVIPASGRPITGADLARQHAMFAAFHQQMVMFQNRGMDSGDCIAQRPLKEFEGQFGDATAFIRGAFHSLNLAYSPE